MKKLYKFYRKPTQEPIDLMNPAIDGISEKTGDDYSSIYNRMKNSYLLSAYTDDRQIANQFEAERDMDKYQVWIDEIPEEEFEEYQLSHSEFRLGYVPYNRHEDEEEVLILSTDGEKLVTEESTYNIYENIYGKEYTYNIFLLKDKYVEYLWKINYLDILKIIGNPELAIASADKKWKDLMTEDYDTSVFEVNEFVMYSKMFSSCYSLKKG